MATIKKSAKSAPKMTKPVSPARKGAPKPKMAPMPPQQAPQAPMGGGQPMMKKGGKIKKYQQGGGVSKDTVKGEMTGKSYPKSEMDSWQKQQAAALTKQAASSQKGAVKKTMKSGGKMKKCC